jgi:selenocysteine lyase/cysteine desulfurase
MCIEAMPPGPGGGNLIEDVTFESIRYQESPTRFEAGTGNIADVVRLGAAFEYLSRRSVFVSRSAPRPGPGRRSVQDS